MKTPGTTRRRLLFATAAALCGEAPGLLAAEPEATAPRVDVIGNIENLPQIAGTATILGPEELETARVFTTTEALRKAPGVYVRDEEGFGLRPNIGIRGLNPSRSTKVLLLEDGVPLSYAPYGDNASYYHPPIDRFERIEVFKGSEQIRFGPQTAGGVVNYITPLPTQETSGSVTLSAGNRDYRNGHARISKGGVLLDYVHKSGDGSRDNVHSSINDFNLKAVIGLGDDQALTLRANYYGENSQVGYSGLTEAEFRNFGRFYNPFKNDSFNTDRYGTSATHQVQLSPSAVLTTNAYFAYFSRDWWRQSSTTTDNQCDVAPASPLYPAQTGTFQSDRANGIVVNPDLCNSQQGRLRDYTTYGVEPRLQVNHGTFGIDNELEVAVRAHYETQDRKQINGTRPGARTGTIVEDNERLTEAYSAFVQNRFIFGRWTVTPGVRVEHITYERTNRLANGGTGAAGETDLTELIPGLGATFNPSARTTVYAGVHRGFSPPRVEDIIGNTAVAGALTSAEVPADDAIEAELGVRTTPRDGLFVQAAVFRNDFREQVVVGSVAGGNLPFAFGEALYQGAELSGRAELGTLFGWSQNLYLRAAYQWLPTARQESEFRRVDTGAVIPGGGVEGNRIPYAPKHLLNFGVGYVHPRGFSGEIEMVYTSEQFADFANTEAPAVNGDGQTGILDDYTIFNLVLNYTIPDTRWTTFFTVKNLTDEEYIADRTRGILPGTPRLYHAGVQYRF